MSKILVTGGAGFIGSTLVDKLINDVLEIYKIENDIYEEYDKMLKLMDEPSNFYLLPKINNRIEAGIWILGRRPFAKLMLLKLTISIYQKITDKAKMAIMLFPNLPFDNEISILSKNSSNLKFKYFWDRVIPIIEDNSINIIENSFLEIGNIDSGEDIKLLVNEAVKEGRLMCNMKDSKTYKDNTNNYETTLLKYEIQDYPNKSDIGIITILPPETKAIENVIFSGKKFHGKKTTRIYFKGFMKGDKDINHSVVTTQQINKGNESVISAYRDIVDEFNPKLMILFGVGGSISTETNLCDVCIVDQIIDYDKRKESEEIFIRGNGYNISAKVMVFINEFFNVFGENPEFKSTAGSYKEKFNVKKGPIGSGNAVIGKETSQIKKYLLNYNSKTVAVETESVGFCNVNYEEELNRSNGNISIIIIRGISDQADQEKNDIWRISASNNAAIVLKELLKLFPKIDKVL